MKKFNNEQPEKSRHGDHKLLNIFQEFEVSLNKDEQTNTSGNLRFQFEKTSFGNGGVKYETKYGKNNQEAFCSMVSSPMLLARLVAAGCSPIVANCYKTTWTIILRHKSTGCILTFYDFKGCSSYGSCRKGTQDKEFQKDALTLIKNLINPRFPHPYDGCVVGEIA